MENNMRQSRQKITKNNFDSYKLIVTSLPKHQRGNSLIREAMNISEGTWSYIRRADTYEEFVKLSAVAHTPKKVVSKTMVNPWTGKTATWTGAGDQPKAVPFQPQPIFTPSSVAGELHNINKTLIRLCVAIETKKKGWL